MLTSLVINLKPLENAFLPVNTGSQIHALFFNLLSEANPKLASTVHLDEHIKPFTISTLNGKFARTGSQRVALKNNSYWLRITTLTEPIFSAVTKSLMSHLAKNETLTIGSGTFQIVTVEMKRYGLLVQGQKSKLTLSPWAYENPENVINCVVEKAKNA